MTESSSIRGSSCGSRFPPTVLSVAGSDSGGGAGIQADLQAFRYFGVFGTTAITAVTAQNPKQVCDVHAIPASTVVRQIEAVISEFAVGAVKTGMLFSTELIEAVVEVLSRCLAIPLVVDPVMVATSGAPLLRQDAIAALCDTLLPIASIITPNLHEAEIIVGRPVRDRESMSGAASEMARRYSCWAVVKGGHLGGSRAVDVVSNGAGVWQVAAPAVDAASTHGTGCSLSAAIAACLALGDAPVEALCKAKAYVTGALRACRQVGLDVWAMSPPERLRLDEIECHQIG